jgi:PilZ domain-containing protein
MGQERRRHDRSPNREAQIACTSAEHKQNGKPSTNLAVRLLDTSATGACLVTRDRLREGCPVILGIILPQNKARVMTKGVVRWSTTLEQKGRVAHVTGVEFDKPVAELAPGLPKNGPSHEEPQRRHKRFVPEKVDIVCLPPGFLSKLGMKSNSAKALKNLSLGGAQIVSTEKLETGDRVDLLLKFAFPKTSVRAAGVVRWCRRDTLSLEPRWVIGVKFKELDPTTHSRLRTVEAVFIDVPR